GRRPESPRRPPHPSPAPDARHPPGGPRSVLPSSLSLLFSVWVGDRVLVAGVVAPAVPRGLIGCPRPVTFVPRLRLDAVDEPVELGALPRHGPDVRRLFSRVLLAHLLLVRHVVTHRPHRPSRARPLRTPTSPAPPRSPSPGSPRS